PSPTGSRPPGGPTASRSSTRADWWRSAPTPASSPTAGATPSCSARGREVCGRRAERGGRMHEKSKIRLEEILAEHERLRAEAAVHLEEDARITATFMDRFERMKDSIIRPVLEETCETLAARGHEAWLEDGSTGADERIKDARVSLLVTPRRSDGLRTDSGRVMFYAERG